MKLYLKYILLMLKSQLQYKASFFMTVFTQLMIPFIALAGIYLLFHRFGSIKGWEVYEIFLCYSVIGASFAISTCMARGFDSFAGLVRNAGFDRILVRPRGTVIQVLGSQFDIKRIGHLIQAIVILFVAISGVNVQWNVFRIITIINMILGGTCIFTGVYMLQAVMAFWTVEALEAANILTHGMREYASYPLDIFPKWISRFFTFLVPFGCVNYIPLKWVLGHIGGNAITYMLIPLLGVIFVIPCTFAWNFGVRHYKSTGS